MKYIKEHYNEFNNYYTKKKAFEIDIDLVQKTNNQKKKINKFIQEKEKLKKNTENQIFIQEIKSSVENDYLNSNFLKFSSVIFNKKKYSINIKKEKKDDDVKVIKPINNKTLKNIKILLLGEHFSGKTSIIQRIIYNKMTNEYNTTTRIKIFKCPFIDYNNNFVELTFIDTPPIQQIINKLTFCLNDNIDIILFVFDVTNKGSFQRLIKYINDIEFVENMIIGIIANKQDLCPEYIKYKIHELKDYCYENNISFLVISILKDTEHIFDFLNIILSKKIQNK